MDLPKGYSPKDVESDIYKKWEESGYFNPDNLPGDREKSFTISIPPPNATGTLHVGHAAMLAIEDIFIRHARMQGYDTLWVPGTDHAAIATESVVIKKIQKEDRIKDPRKELGREEVLKRIEKFVENSRATINSQIRAMGASVDWSREGYTMDPTLNRAVNEVFVKMHEDGLIYRGHRIVNWDPKLQTTVSDDEIEREEIKGKFYYLKYGPFTIATARPETKFGDKYVVMHPDDDRYKDYKHGDTFECEWINGKITATIIKDKAIDMELGTGVMTITPWHDMTDFEIAKRHNLDKEQIIGWDGKLLEIAGEFAGMSIIDARDKIIEKLQKKGLVEKIDEDYVHSVAKGDRSKGLLEPQIKEQWFVDVNKRVVDWKGKKMSLKEVMQDTVRSGDIAIVPDRFEKIYFNWIDNLHDWCISRQIWWGHRIPAYYCWDCNLDLIKNNISLFADRDNDESGAVHYGSDTDELIPDFEHFVRILNEGKRRINISMKPIVGTKIDKCPTCKSTKVFQDPDTLDTWFSSALWTWSTLIDKELAKDGTLSLQELLDKSGDFKRFHPTTIMDTGYDIIFFWVARMILMTTYATGQIPFKTVYLHGLVLDKNGKKMSKSKPETIIDPLEVIEEYGTDALRLALIVGTSPGNDQRLSKDKIGGYRNFVNKIWNISRFAMMNIEKESEINEPKPKTLTDEWILSRLNTLITEIDAHLANYRLSQALEELYDFMWHEFADWYIEIAKLEENKQDILVHVLSVTLRIFHPFIPFVTEHIWKLLGSHVKADKMFEDQIIIASWPLPNNELINEEAEKQFNSFKEVVVAIRNHKSENGIKMKEQIEIHESITKGLSDELRSLAQSLVHVKFTKNGQTI